MTRAREELLSQCACVGNHAHISGYICRNKATRAGFCEICAHWHKEQEAIRLELEKSAKRP